MARYRISIASNNRDEMLDLVRQYKIQVLDHGIRKSATEAYVVDALADEQDIAMLETKGYKVERHEDVDEAGKERQREVGRGNRYSKNPPR